MSAVSAAAAMEIARKISAEIKKTANERDLSFEFPYAEMQALKESGLGIAAIPAQFGGWGLSYTDMVEIIRIISMGSMSIGQMFATSHTICVQEFTAILPPALAQKVLTQMAAEKLLVGNASSERHSKDIMSYTTSFTPAKDGKGVLVNGEKFFCTGSPSADLLYVLGILEGNYAMLLMDPKSPGVEHVGDWRPIGQRGTGSGTIRFKDAFVSNDYVMRDIVKMDAPQLQNLFGPVIQGYFCAVFLGTARAAFDTAMEYINKYTRPWFTSGVATGAEDPYILSKAGELAAWLGAAEAQLRDMCISVEAVLTARATNDPNLAQIRADAMAKVAEAKIFATEVGLRVTSEIFQMCGARSAMAEYDLDRYWRDIRTLSLHDPVAYKMKLVGEYHVLGRHPFPTFVS